MKQSGVIVLFAAIIAFGLAGFGPQPKIEEGTYPSPCPFAPSQIVNSGSNSDINLQISTFKFESSPAPCPTPVPSP